MLDAAEMLMKENGVGCITNGARYVLLYVLNEIHTVSLLHMGVQF